MTAVLELREVSKVYGSGAAEVHALRRVSLSVGAGELVAVMGPSGSGKSTLLTIAGSLEEPTSGQVLVAGADLSGASLNDQAKLRRRRAHGSDVTCEQDNVVRQHVRAAAGLLDWLTAQHLTLADCRQGDLERWLTTGHALNRSPAGHFIRWAARQHLTALDFPATRWQGPARPMDDQARWDAARRLLHDGTISTRDRLAGLLVVLYAQPTARISRLTTSHIETAGTQVTIRLGQAPITLPGPVATLTQQYLASHRGRAATGADAPSPWLFPGGQPGRPITAGHLGHQLKTIGIHPGQTRSTALFQLATELPAGILARMLGIHINVAVAWQHASAGDWTTYAADISRRGPRKP
jgi:energy-coupling factor transporter ATP-binding protein EcfA2